MALLAVAPTVLIGCSGGSSSNNSSSTVRADLKFSASGNPNVIPPTKVKGTFQPQGEINGEPDFTVGDGVYSFYIPFANQPEGTGVRSDAVLLNNSTENRFMQIDRDATTGTADTVGTVYDIAKPFIRYVGIRFTRTFKDNTPVADYLASSGTVTVKAVKGSLVTLELKNVVLSSFPDGSTSAPLRLNGTITYDRENIVIRPPSTNDANAARQKSAKN